LGLSPDSDWRGWIALGEHSGALNDRARTRPLSATGRAIVVYGLALSLEQADLTAVRWIVIFLAYRGGIVGGQLAWSLHKTVPIVAGGGRPAPQVRLSLTYTVMKDDSWCGFPGGGPAAQVDVGPNRW